MLLIRIRMDPHHFGILDPHLNPYPHKIKVRIRIRIRIRVISWIRIRINLQGQAKMCGIWYEPILALFKGLSLYLEARIWIRIRVKRRIRIRVK